MFSHIAFKDQSIFVNIILEMCFSVNYIITLKMTNSQTILKHKLAD